jgi:hypothetical protein
VSCSQYLTYALATTRCSCTQPTSSRRYYSRGTAHPVVSTVHAVLLIQSWYCSFAAAAGSLPRAVTMPDDTEVAALCARLEAIVKEAEDAEAQATAARRHVQAARFLLEESKAAALEQTATAVCQRVPSSSSSLSSPVAATASQLVPTASSTYEDTVVVELHVQAVAVLNVHQLMNIIRDFYTNYAS